MLSEFLETLQGGQAGRLVKLATVAQGLTQEPPEGTLREVARSGRQPEEFSGMIEEEPKGFLETGFTPLHAP